MCCRTRKRKIVRESQQQPVVVSGEDSWSSSSPVSAMLWVWVMCGASPTWFTLMEEVSFPFLHCSRTCTSLLLLLSRTSIEIK
jgi:hypothetical protein